MTVATAPADSTPPRVEITGLRKVFRRRSGAGDVIPIDGVSLNIAEGEILVLLGPSGCGKTTLLRTVAGLQRPDNGTIRISGCTVYDSSSRLFLPPNKRPISMIFQSYALWPHMTVFKNVAYPIAAKRTKSEVAEAVEQVLERVGLVGLGRQYPGQLSGGQQQRVALARALLTDAKVILFDEPLSNVDAKVREELRAQLVEMQRELGFTAIYVTHDQAEAMELADRIAVLNAGRIEQVGPPRDIYARPLTRYVAEFVGSANLYDGTVATVDEEAAEIDTALGMVTVAQPHACWTGRPPRAGDHVTAMFRPEDCAVATEPPPPGTAWRAQLVRTSFVGTQQHLLLNVNGQRILASVPKDLELPEAGEVWVRVDATRAHLLPRTTDTRNSQS